MDPGRREAIWKAAVIILMAATVMLSVLKYLNDFYSAASGEEAGWSLLFMPIIISCLIGLGASAALPMALGLFTKSSNQPVFLMIGFCLPTLVLALVPIADDGRSVSNHSLDIGYLFHASGWRMLGGIWVISIVYLAVTNYVGRASIADEDKDNEQT